MGRINLESSSQPGCFPPASPLGNTSRITSTYLTPDAEAQDEPHRLWSVSRRDGPEMVHRRSCYGKVQRETTSPGRLRQLISLPFQGAPVHKDRCSFRRSASVH